MLFRFISAFRFRFSLKKKGKTKFLCRSQKPKVFFDFFQIIPHVVAPHVIDVVVVFVVVFVVVVVVPVVPVIVAVVVASCYSGC